MMQILEDKGKGNVPYDKGNDKGKDKDKGNGAKGNDKGNGEDKEQEEADLEESSLEEEEDEATMWRRLQGYEAASERAPNCARVILDVPEQYKTL